jgi:L-ascorbate metabolism protein UlaG (beta-lactamase superfamily)
MRKTIILTIALLLASAGRHANADFTFDMPTNLRPTINSTSNETVVCLSPDGLEMYFMSDRPGGSGDWDIWVTKRATINADWDPSGNLGPTVNSPEFEGGAHISPDSLALYFESKRPGGQGIVDIWTTTRVSKNDPWTTPMNLGPPVNSPYGETCPEVSADGLELYFSSGDRPGGSGKKDIWVSTRTSVEDPWGEPANLGSVVNTVHMDDYIWLSPDGLLLVFDSDRPGGFGGYDLWITRRASRNDPWAIPVNLGPTVNGPGLEALGALSANGRMLYFCSDRPGGLGGGWGDIWQAPIIPVVDFNGDEIVDFKDLSKLVQYWLHNEPSVDIAPPLGDGKVDFKDLVVLTGLWLEEYEEILYIKWFAHASVKVWTEDAVVYVDPRNLSESPHDATLVLVTHTHGDHYQPASITRVSNSQTKFIAPPDVVQQYGQGQAIAPGQTTQSDGVYVTGVASYNTNKTNHPKSRNWVGYIIELGGKRVYVAGDTDLIPEMQTLGEIDVAFLPAGGTYTMNATEAAQAAAIISPTLAIPYHWGTSVGTLADAQTFAQLARCAVKIMAAGETIGSDNWPEYSPLTAHWKLDETEGSVAHDSADDNDGTLHNNPAWQPSGGKVDGALQFNGADNYVSTPSVLDPVDGSFSIFAWVNGDAAGQVIISQTDGTGTGATWLGTEQSQGKLMTGLVPPRSGRFVTPPLVSEFTITDGLWHHVGFVWDGSLRYLYADGTEVARDAATLAPLISADGNLYIGAGKDLDVASFFSGLIDDIRVYNQALSAEEIEELAR